MDKDPACSPLLLLSIGCAESRSTLLSHLLSADTPSLPSFSFLLPSSCLLLVLFFLCPSSLTFSLLPYSPPFFPAFLFISFPFPNSLSLSLPFFFILFLLSFLPSSPLPSLSFCPEALTISCTPKQLGSPPTAYTSYGLGRTRQILWFFITR